MELKKTSILVVDDDEDTLTAATLLLKRHFGNIITCANPKEIPQLLVRHTFHAILLDMNFSPGERTGEQGFYWLNRILSAFPEAIVVLITAHGDVSIAVEAIKHGATDFICKPWENEKVVATLTSAIRLFESKSELSQLKKSNQLLIQDNQKAKQALLGSSQAMQDIHIMIDRAAPTDANVLILGENGTGKELVAREIHQKSLRKDHIFMSVDLGAVSESLFESELFGHKKGAFSGASADRIGRFVAASGGTLFLDEIGNIPLHLQVKLLTVLEQRQVTPIGSNIPIPIDVRVIAATNANYTSLTTDSEFRQDLLYRLNTVEIHLPPLRERVEDIREIAQYYLAFYAQKYKKDIQSFSEEALISAEQYAWPGNIRSLRHAIERAVILSDSETSINDLNLQTTQSGHTQTFTKETTDSEDLHLERVEKRTIETALRKHRFNISKAAKELGLTRASLYRRMEKHGL